jgi:hypothetical protein
VLLLSAGGASGAATLGICRIPLALLLGAAPAPADMQTARGSAECVSDSGLCGSIAFKLQLKRLPLSYSARSPVKAAAPADISAASSIRLPRPQTTEEKERLLQVSDLFLRPRTNKVEECNLKLMYHYAHAGLMKQDRRQQCFGSVAFWYRTDLDPWIRTSD